jgi:hypothetical protein
VSACAALWGFQDTIGGADGSADGSVGDGGRADHTVDGGRGDAPGDVTDAAVDVTGLCARSLSNSIYVSHASGHDVSACGTQAVPCLTIKQGLMKATAEVEAGIVRLAIAEGTYNENVTLEKGISLVGGWVIDGGAWEEDLSDAAAEKLFIIPTGPTAVTASSLGGGAALCTLTVGSKATADPGETLYGVFATGDTTLLLGNVEVEVNGGGDGGSGATGSVGDPGNPAAGCTAASGMMGTPVGMRGSPGKGKFGNSGYEPGNGEDGGTGTPGENGTPGGPGSTETCVDKCLTCVIGTKHKETGGTGLSGCAGKGGEPGTGGGGGGSSVGIFAWGATITIEGGDIVVGNGGNGAPGGTGGDGGAGSAGKPGAPGAKCPTSCGSLPKCGKTADLAPEGGAPGGPGGPGSSGGAGGPGSGGFSCPIVEGDHAKVAAHGVKTSPGSPGSGAPGAPTGGTPNDSGVCSF